MLYTFSGRSNSVDHIECSPPSRRVDGGRYWDTYLTLGEEHVFGGIVWKRKGLFSKRRQLVLTSKPRLLYFDPSTMELKGEIPWSAECPVECIPMTGTSFDILAKSTGRRYHITDSEAGSQMWMDLIAAMVQKQKEIMDGTRENVYSGPMAGEGESNPSSPKNRSFSDAEDMAGSLASNIDIVITSSQIGKIGELDISS